MSSAAGMEEDSLDSEDVGKMEYYLWFDLYFYK